MGHDEFMASRFYFEMFENNVSEEEECFCQKICSERAWRPGAMSGELPNDIGELWSSMAVNECGGADRNDVHGRDMNRTMAQACREFRFSAIAMR